MIEILTAAESLQRIEPAWRRLWQHAGAPAFLSPDWLIPWWHCFGTNELRLTVLHGSSGLAGLLPFYGLREATDFKLLPLGVGISDYFDVLLAPGSDAALPAMLACTAARASVDGITSWTWPELPPGSLLHNAPPPPGWRDAASNETPCPVLTIGDPIPAGTQRNIRQSRHRATRQGGWNVRSAAQEHAPELWQHLAQFHAARWQDCGVLADPLVQQFHRHAVPRLAAAGTLNFQLLEFAGRISALYYTLQEPGRLLFYLSGFDADDHFISPGTILMSHILDQAPQAGWRELHFLRGSEPYKYAWGANDRMNKTRVLHPA